MDDSEKYLTRRDASGSPFTKLYFVRQNGRSWTGVVRFISSVSATLDLVLSVSTSHWEASFSANRDLRGNNALIRICFYKAAYDDTERTSVALSNTTIS